MTHPGLLQDSDKLLAVTKYLFSISKAEWKVGALENPIRDIKIYENVNIGSLNGRTVCDAFFFWPLWNLNFFFT